MRVPEKGIVLITTMLLLSFIIMIASLLIVTGRNTLLLGSSYSEREQAQYAAEAGIGYAQYCISKNMAWQAEGFYSPSSESSDFGDFTVTQVGAATNRTIKGSLRNGGATFYITFSTAPRTDGEPVNYKKLLYYSKNNLASSAVAQSQKYNGAILVPFKTVKERNAHIIVEGRSGTASRYAEAILKLNDTSMGNACTITAGDIKVDLADKDGVFLVNTEGTGNSMIRSMGSIHVDIAPGPSEKKCFQIANSGVSYTGKTGDTTQRTYVNATAIDTTTEMNDYKLQTNWTGQQDDYLKKSKVKWSDAAGKYESGGSFTGSVSSKIKGGSYVYINADLYSTVYDLYYIDKPFDPTTAGSFVNDNLATLLTTPYAGNEASLVSGTALTVVSQADLGTNPGFLMKVNNPLGVDQSTGGVKDLNLLVYSVGEGGLYEPSSKYRTSLRLEKPSDAHDPCLVTLSDATAGAGGDIYIDGELSGIGKVLSGGSLNYQGRSILEADPLAGDGGLSIYTQGTVKIAPARGSGGSDDKVNDALTAAIHAFLGAGDTTGFHDTTYKKYNELRDKLLDTTIPAGSYGASGKLKDVLTKPTASGGLGFDKKTSDELVTQILNKNTFLDTGTQTVGGTETSDPYNIPTNLGTTSQNSVTLPNTGYKISIRKTSQTGSILVFIQNGSSTDGYAVNSSSTWSGYNSPSVTSSVTSTTFASCTGAVDGVMVLHLTKAGKTDDISVRIGPSGPGAGLFDVTYGTSTTTGTGTGNIMLLGTPDQNFTLLTFNDTLVKGLIYTWEDLYCPDMQGGSFTIRGGIVAYGGNPETQNPGAVGGKGKVTIQQSKYVTFTYDPAYMSMILGLGSGIITNRVFLGTF